MKDEKKYVTDTVGYLKTFMTLDEALKELVRVKQVAKEGGWKNVSLEMDVQDSYGATTTTCKITGHRPETALERRDRLDKDLLIQKNQQERELTELARLKKKYEKQP